MNTPVTDFDPAPDFDGAWVSVADVDGWMSHDQARRLWDRAGEVADGAQIVEIGSFRGRSMIMLASSAPEGTEIVAIDPHIGTDRGPQEIVTTSELGQSDNEVFVANLTRAGVIDRVRHVRKLSADALGDVTGPIDLLYIDGAHRYGPARADMVDWGRRVTDGGTLLVHDSWSSIGVTFALLRTYLFSSEWSYVGRSRSLAEYRRGPMSAAARRRSQARQLRELGWFARNVLIKVLLTARLGRLTRLLGHDGETWPY
ncbi:MAG TPA: class I SAM-dependent methyltransferase [Acidimicrobiales bacterium]|nr:class I SAM-dependent methyltransferase [Acidimicrobiales bacterium]